MPSEITVTDFVFTKRDDVSDAIAEASIKCGKCEHEGRFYRRRWGFPIDRAEEFDKNGYFAWKVTFTLD